MIAPNLPSSGPPHRSRHEPRAALNPSPLWADAQRGSPALAATACLLLAMMLPAALAMAIDTRLLDGISVWVKPLKFQFSVALQLLTVAWVANLLPRHEREGRTLRRLALALIAAGMFEVLYISLQAARGQASHFNQSSLIAGVMYTLMGAGSLVLVGATGWIGWLVLRHGDRRDPLVFAAGWGLVLGSALGGLAGTYLGAQSGHWVGGTRSDAGGLPIVGWSRDGGDLRVAHFIGLHLMQAMPLAAWLLRDRIAGATNRRVVTFIAVAGTALTIALFAQAIAGRPVIGA